MKENIEEDIEYIEALIKIASQLPSGELKIQEKEIEALNDILSDYKRVLKESEKYKNMYEAEHRIHLLRNEQLDKKQKAIIRCNELENIAKELQIKNAELKDRWNNDTHKLQNDLDIANAKIIELLKENEELKIIKSLIQTLEANQIQEDKYILITKRDFLSGSYKSLLDDYIPIQKVKERIKEIRKEIDKAIDNSKGGLDEEFIDKGIELLAQVRILQELLESEE